MKLYYLVYFTLHIMYLFSGVEAEYEDKRCICVCPSLSVNSSKSKAEVYRKPVPPSKCDCENVVDIKDMDKDFCPRCECKYESRNTTTIEVVVIFIIWILSLLVLYMGFLLCLDPILNKRRAQPSYREQMDEDDEASVGGASGMSQPLRVRPNVLGRVTHQQDKWKRQVQEQRKNIYDRHTMLN